MSFGTLSLIFGIVCAAALNNSHVQGQTPSLSPQVSPIAVEGRSFQFTCIVSGSGSLSGALAFQRGSFPAFSPCVVNSGTCSQFSNAGGYSCACVSGQTRVFYMNITSVRRVDDDNWRCQYSASISNTVTLDVHYPPAITYVHSSKDVRENTRPNINCNSNITPGNPSSTSYRWTGPGGYNKTGAVLDRTVTRTRGGQYTCTATNTAGLSDTATVNINVQYAPIITAVPSSTNVGEITRLNIDCNSNITPGNPSSTSYSWTGPGGYSKTGAVLDRNVTRTQGGQYTCTATNTAGLSDTATVNINVQYAPDKPTITNPGTLCEGQSTSLTCSSSPDSGNPPATYYWTRNNVAVSTGGTYTFTPGRGDHQAQIRCAAGSNYTDTAGLSRPQSNIRQLDVYYIPRISITPANTQTKLEGGNLTLTCSADSNPDNAVLSWMFAGTTLPGPRVVKTNLKSTDQGEYKCTGTVTTGSVCPNGRLLGNNHVFVLVYCQTPSLSPQDYTTAVEDRSFQFTCTVTGSGSLSLMLSFQRLSSPVFGACSVYTCFQVTNDDGYSCGCVSGKTRVLYMNITSVRRQDSSNWGCQYRTSISNTVSLNVHYPPDKPTITNPETLCEGQSTSLTCSSSPDPGNPPATYYWTRNNVAVSTGGTYPFTPGRDDHQAEIICAAGNDHTDRAGHSRPQSTSRQLDVYYTPKISTSPAGTQTRREGQSLYLTCSANSNPSGAVLSWTFSGTPPPLAGVTVQKTNLSRSDHGDYTCTGRVNTGGVCPGGSLQGTGSVSVIVNYAPDVIFEPVDIRESETLTLTCRADGRPASYTFGSFSQYWGDTEVDSHTGTETEAGAVYSTVIQAASYLDTGMYECSVDNTVRDRQDVLIQRKKVSVSVRAQPKFTSDSPQRIADEIGSTVTLSQTFYNSNINYTNVTWTFVKSQSELNEANTVKKSNVTLQKNNNAVKFEGFAATFVISSFQEKDIGVYSVTACNVIGCSSSDVNLTAAGPPLVPLEFSILNTTQTSISLRWKPNYPGGPFTQVFILHYRLQGTENWKTVEYDDNEGFVFADISDLQPGSVYEVKVRARNNRDTTNEGDFTDTLEGITKAVPGDANPSSSLAVGLGIGLGICVPIILGVVVLVVYLRRKMISSGNKDRTQESNRQDQRATGASQNTAYLPDSSANQNRAEYAKLESCRPQQYEQLRLYENTKVHKPHDVSEYSGLQDRQPASYDTVALHTYANDVTMPKDPTYVNTSNT